jgi:hypothetical protein
MIEAAKVIVPIGQGNEVEARAIAAGLRAFTEPYREDGVDEVIVEAENETSLFEESLVVQAIGDTQYSEVQVFVPDSLLISAKAKMEELGIPERYCQMLWIGFSSHAATFSSVPSTSFPFLNFAPALTNATR